MGSLTNLFGLSNIMDYIWIAVIALSILVELGTVALVSIWFAIGAALALVVSLLNGPPWLQTLVFIVVSTLLLALFFTKFQNKRLAKTNTDLLIGKKCVVIQTINGLESIGTIEVNGQYWTAKTENLNEIISKASVVEIVRIEGSSAIVKKYIKEA